MCTWPNELGNFSRLIDFSSLNFRPPSFVDPEHFVNAIDRFDPYQYIPDDGGEDKNDEESARPVQGQLVRADPERR